MFAKESMHGLPGGNIGLAGSRHSSLRDKILPLPDFVQQAMNLSFGRTAIPTKLNKLPKSLNQFDYFGGEARLLQEAEEARLNKLLEDDDSDSEEQNQNPSVKNKEKKGAGYPTTGKVKLSVSISSQGLARCLAGHQEARERLQTLEAACQKVHATPVSQHLLDLLSNSKKKAMSAAKKTATTKTSVSIKQVAKKSWGKLRNVVQSGFGMSMAAAQTKAVEEAMSKIDDGDGKSALLALSALDTLAVSQSKKTETKRTRRKKTPRLKDGRIVPPWQPPPNECLPALKVKPRDVALLRVCKIPREWAEQWLSGKDAPPEIPITNIVPLSKPGKKGKGNKKGFKSSTSMSSMSLITNKKTKHVTGKVKKSAMSWNEARSTLPHSHTYLFQHTGRFVTTLLDRSRLLKMLREHPMGPTPETLHASVAVLKAERPHDSGPSGATFDRRIDTLSYRQAPRAVISHGTAGGHTHALEREVRHSVGPGPGVVGLLDHIGFGTNKGSYRQGAAFSQSNHYSKMSLTMLANKSKQAHEMEESGPGPSYVENSEHSSLYQIPGGNITLGPRFLNNEFVTPAPHDYEINRGEALLSTVSGMKTRGGVIAGKDKSELDFLIRRSAAVPGPMAYKPKRQDSVNAPRFSTTFAPSELELVMRHSSRTPGPGLYFGSSGGVARNLNILEGGNAPKFTSGNYPSELDQIISRAKETPGPGLKFDYTLQSQYQSTQKGAPKFVYPPTETQEEAEGRRNAKLPGPSRYADAYLQAIDERMSGGRFSTAYPPTDLEVTIRNSKVVPGPADYGIGVVNKKEAFAPGAMGSGLGKMRKTSGIIISKSKIPSMTEQAMIDSSKSPFWVHKQGDDKKIRRHVGGSVGRISDANPKSEADLIIERASQTPAPDLYDIGNGMSQNVLNRRGGKISQAFVPSALEVTIERARKRPGPSRYQIKDNKRRVSAPKFSTSSELRSVEQIMKQARLTPGPTDYEPY